MPRLKATAALAALTAALTAVVCAGVGPVKAQAEPLSRVILLEDPAAPPPESLVQALRIQLSGVASLERAAAASGAALETDAEHRARERGVAAVLWLPDDASERQDATALHALGLTEGAAQHELVRVPDGARPDVERSLALKVRELLHGWRQQRAAFEARERALPEPAAGEPEPLGSERAWGAPALALAAGVRAGPLSQRVQWGALVAAGAAFDAGELRLIGALELSWSPEIELSRGATHATLEELAPGVIARAELRQGDLWLGAHGGLSLSLLRATGSDGRERAEARQELVSALFGLHAELEVAAGFGLYGGAGVQLRLHREHFAVDGVELIDVGRLRPIATLALCWSWPEPGSSRPRS